MTRPDLPELGCPEEHEPMSEWVGSQEFKHGERDDCQACFCGAPYYLHCPGWLDNKLSHATIERADS